MDWTGRRVLVTGGAGFLGANLCHTLAQRGAKVIVWDRDILLAPTALISL